MSFVQIFFVAILFAPAFLQNPKPDLRMCADHFTVVSVPFRWFKTRHTTEAKSDLFDLIQYFFLNIFFPFKSGPGQTKRMPACTKLKTVE